jgi:5'-nucleotidase
MKRLLFSAAWLILSTTAHAAEQPDTPIQVVFLHVNDVYQFMPVDGGTRGGLARVLTLKQQAQRQYPHVLLTLGGDTLSPSAETRLYQGAQMIDAWNALGLELAVFGNHEFDLPVSTLRERLAESRFTWLGANVLDTQTGTTFADTPAFVIREFEGVRIGMLGLLLPQAKQTSAMDASLEVADYCITAARLVDQLRGVEQVDAVVALTHLFLRQDQQLARCTRLDLILGGHEHVLLQSSVNGTPIFKMTADARELGQFRLSFDRTTKRLLAIDWEIIPVTDAIADAPEFTPVVDKYREVLEQIDEEVGATAVMLDALSRSNRQRETNLGNFIADSYRNATGAEIGFFNGGSIRSDLSYYPGPLTKRDLISILPFDNRVLKVAISGKTLLQALEHGVARSAEDSEPGRFPQISGMRFAFDATKPAGARVTSVTVAGEPLNPKRRYTLATTDFLVTRGGDGYAMLADAEVLTDVTQAKRDAEVLRQAIEAAPSATIAPQVEGRITRVDTLAATRATSQPNNAR